MKKLLLLCLSAVLLVSNANAQAAAGIKFFEGTFEEALEQAGKEDKIIFMDAYASWCGPCKAMSRNVFPNKEVGDFYNEKFINLKIDWESDLGSKLHSKFPIRAYPTLMYIGADGKRIAMAEGYHDAKSLIKQGEAVLKKVAK